MTKSNETNKEDDLDSKDSKIVDSIFVEINSSNHHAFLIETKDREGVFLSLKDFFFNKEKRNEDLLLYLQIFDIDKAREIINYVNHVFNKTHFIIVSFYSINREAQNALLKFLEETPKNIKIIFIIPTGAKILDTMYSRFYKLGDFNNKKNLYHDDEYIYKSLVKNFLKTEKKSRMKIKEIVELLEKKDEYALNFEDKERSDREVVEIFLLALYEELFSLFKDEINKNTNLEKIKEVENNLSELKEFLIYIKNNSSSGKTILEYLSLKLIQID